MEQDRCRAWSKSAERPRHEERSWHIVTLLASCTCQLLVYNCGVSTVYMRYIQKKYIDVTKQNENAGPGMQQENE